jgi:acetylornithine deacetylase/succinyl-diaminopimelate desuccinylase-like protein
MGNAALTHLHSIANLFGRGSSDMKSGLPAMIHAAAAARDEGLLKSGRIGFVLVPDEETAGPFPIPKQCSPK